MINHEKPAVCGLQRPALTDYNQPTMTVSRKILLRSLTTISLFGMTGWVVPAHAGMDTANHRSVKVSAAPEAKDIAIKSDINMSCDQIANEVVELDRVIHKARATQQDSDNAGTGVSIAKTVGSLLVGSLGGVVGIVAVGALAGEAAENSGENAAKIEESAEERQNRLAGVFDGKGCEGELALTEDAPEKVAKIEPASGTAPASQKRRYNE